MESARFAIMVNGTPLCIVPALLAWISKSGTLYNAEMNLANYMK